MRPEKQLVPRPYRPPARDDLFRCEFPVLLRVTTTDYYNDRTYVRIVDSPIQQTPRGSLWVPGKLATADFLPVQWETIDGANFDTNSARPIGGGA